MSDGRLVICGTPIGNLEDLSKRQVEALKEADVVYAEDTRRTSRLMSHVGSDARLRSLFTGNETGRSHELVKELAEGAQVVLVTDAGMPSVSDPGSLAVRLAREAGHEVTVVPGPSAVTAAVAVAGFGGGGFTFFGFMPRKGAERESVLARVCREALPSVLFCSPNRLAADLKDLESRCGGDRQVLVARELTKLHEQLWWGRLGDAAEEFASARGEVTVVVAPGDLPAPTLDDAVAMALEELDGGVSLSAAARAAAETSGVSRRDIYQELIRRQERS